MRCRRVKKQGFTRSEALFSLCIDHKHQTWPQDAPSIHPIEADDDLDSVLPRLLPLDFAPPLRIYQHLLKLCQRQKACALDHTLFLFTHLVVHQRGFLNSLGDALVFTLSKCGALEDALYLFNVLPSRSVFSWTSMISGYVEYRHEMDAFRMLVYMREDGLEPDKYVFVSILKACGNVRDIELGRKLHFDAQQKDFVADVYVGSTLVSVYGKCGYVVEAENVFCNLHCRNIVSWNAMLSAYVHQNQCERALLLFRQMQEEGQKPNELTYISSIRSCSIFSQNSEPCHAAMGSTRETSLGIGQALHADVRKRNLDSHPLIGNALMMMYGRFGILSCAENMFVSLSHDDVVVWNAILLAYVERGQGRKSLQMLKLMYEQLVSPDGHSFSISLQACCSLVEEDDMIMDEDVTKKLVLEIGQALYADIERKGLMADAFVVCTLIHLYGKCAMVEIAESIFSELPVRDVVAWSAMLSTYVEQGLGHECLQAYRQMYEEGVHTDQHALVIALQACGIIGEKQERTNFQSGAAREIGYALHADACRRRYTNVPSVCNSLINMYGRCGMLTEAQYVFKGLLERNVVSWNSILSAFVEQGKRIEVLQLYPKMLEENVAPDDLTFLIILQACGGYPEETMHQNNEAVTMKSMEIGEALHSDALRRGLLTCVTLCDAIVNMYVKNGNFEKALGILHAFPCLGSLAWNALLSAFAEHGQGCIALQIYEKIQNSGIVVFSTSMVHCLQVCSEASCLETCRHLHFSIVAANHESALTIANTLVHAYGSCGCMEDSQQVFDGLIEPDVVSWNACLTGYGRQGSSLQCLGKMHVSGTDPNEVSYLSLLSACSHAGDIGRGIEYLESMYRDYSLTSMKNHHAAVVDLLGRAGDFRHVVDLLWRLQGQTDLSIWLRLLGVCRSHSNVELGRWAFDHALHSHPEVTTLYIWMSNIYAADAIEACECEVKTSSEQNQCSLGLLYDTMEINEKRSVCVYHQGIESELCVH